MESFRWMGEELWRLNGRRLREAAAAYDADLARTVPHERQDAFERGQLAFADEAVDWLHRHNRSVHGRIAGYLALGRRCDFAYPWPVVAVLGIVQVLEGLRRMHTWGVLGAAVKRAGYDEIERIAEASDDVLKRTNRGIFADSVPTVLYALRASDLRARGETALADDLLVGPLPFAMDDDSRAIARGLYDGLAIADERARFRALADLTARHFEREQAIFTHHLGGDITERTPRHESTWGRRLSRPTSVPAPAITHDHRGARRLEFRPYPLPPDFDMRDHRARVTAFSAAFVHSVTRTPEDYALARSWVTTRFPDRRPRQR